MPIAYSICLWMAYFGPNAEIIGNVKNSYWQYSAIKNIDVTLVWIAIMFLVDFGSTVISIVLLRWFCKMNILTMYLQVQKQMWYILAIQQGYLVSEVSIAYHIY